MQNSEVYKLRSVAKVWKATGDPKVMFYIFIVHYKSILSDLVSNSGQVMIGHRGPPSHVLYIHINSILGGHVYKLGQVMIENMTV